MIICPIYGKRSVKQTNDEGNIPKSKMSLIHDDGDLRLDPT
jgi:hypothetical protein